MTSIEHVKEQQRISTAQNHFSCFSTKDYHLTATQRMAILHIPVENTAQSNTEIVACFEQLKQAGCSNPILIGAIPFDTSKNCSLNFYADFQKNPKTTSPEFNDLKTVRNNEILEKKAIIQQQKFEQTVHKALVAFDQAQVKKVVLSQAIEYIFAQQHQPQHLADVLVTQNPQAYNFVVPVEQDCHLLGASPELLLSKQDRIVCSNPLAGSRPRSYIADTDTAAKKALQASQKDRHEHQIVVDNVLKNLASHCTELEVSSCPDVLETSTMLHLSSHFHGVLKKNAPDVLNLALKLHPTPAVCGTPTQQAKQFILEHEGYDRHYYAGLVGWMDAQGNGEWVVTIRCGLLNQNKMRLYAGAGIVKGSEAEKEWLETEAKMQTMLNVFQSND